MSNCAYRSAGDTIPGNWPQLSAPAAPRASARYCNDPDLQNLCVDPGHTTYHFVPVAIFFAINIYMALFRFTKPSRLPVTPKKLQRNTN